MEKILYKKDQCDELTDWLTPEMFVDVSKYDGSLISINTSNALEGLEIGGYWFTKMGRPFMCLETIGTRRQKVRDIVHFDYQCTEQVGQEYPIIQICISVRMFRKKPKVEIIRDGWTHRTRFW